MSFKEIRESLGITQTELSVLFDVPIGTIRNWEQDGCVPGSAALTLYRLVEEKNQDVLISMITTACKKEYLEMREVLALERLVGKMVPDKLLRGLLELTLMTSNPQWKPKVTRVKKSGK